MTKPTFKQAWMPLALAALTLASGYLGVDKYQQSQIVVKAPEVNVAITSLPASAMRSDQEVKAIAREIAEAIMKEHEGGERFH